MSEIAALLHASPERLSPPFWDPKSVQNLLKIVSKPPCTPEALRRSPKMLPRCLQKPQRGSKKARKTLQRASTKLQNWLPEAFEASFLITMQNYNPRFAVCTSQAPQLGLRSFQKLFSTRKFSTYSSQFAVHRTYFPFIDTTVCISQLAVHTQMLIVHRLGLATFKIRFSQRTDFMVPCTALHGLLGHLYIAQSARVSSSFTMRDAHS